ncbi:hypothetical protein [Desulfovibrio litoralis]|uniref:Lipoprotein n=1 Tax=Desulfovibrio litoralis DSM 11393 TaxID=1121455 RepID=A0A1M7TD35_9BACT|nr:hypothetical protein [Desulfovibrio litoralis]SHN68659.1 hypothetical protein SAMN02745728_01868 [Desulfovibrio litoralis DSM 11393]
MRQLYKLCALVFLTVLLSACAGIMGSDTPGAEGYYYGEFPDIPIPNDLAEKTGDTYITYIAGGMKAGQQIFQGRVEKNSLVTAMRQYMSKEGWSQRAASYYGNKSILTYEKGDRIATLMIADGTIFVTMQINVASRLSDSDVFSDPSVINAMPTGGAEVSTSYGGSSGDNLQEKRLDQ